MLRGRGPRRSTAPAHRKRVGSKLRVMLIEFFLKLKQGGVPVSIREFLTLLEALQKDVVFGSVEDFYYLGRTCLVKDEKYFDRYDRVFAAYFKGIIEVDALAIMVPEEWLKKLVEK